MKANNAPQSVADYCNLLNEKKIIVNEDYQRGEGIWNSRARSFFIESVILGYPIPKIYLYAKMDLRTRSSIKEIVDGQQRSRALQSFFNNKLRLSSNLESIELRGARYKDLSEELQSAFLAYSLPIDEFQGVTEDDVQEAFRRMNSSNIPLNAEEQRNAKFQGPFKWYIVSIARKYRTFLAGLGLVSKRDIVRMQDMRIYAEIIYVLDRGFDTMKSTQLDALYKKYNEDFEEDNQLAVDLERGIDKFIELDALHRKSVLRSHIFQSVVLALISSRRPDLVEMARATAMEHVEAIEAQDYSIDDLSGALENAEEFPELRLFVESCTAKTNVAGPRAVRFLFLEKAVRIYER